MARLLVTDELWTVVEPLLPPKPADPKGGHPFLVSDWAALTGIIFVLKTGIPWEDLPQEMGRGSGMTCWRRLRAWQEAGVWQRLHHALLNRLGAAGKIDERHDAIYEAFLHLGCALICCQFLLRRRLC